MPKVNPDTTLSSSRGLRPRVGGASVRGKQLMSKYNHSGIESKWQKRWEGEGLYKTPEKPSKNKSYVLDMFPYPSGASMHVGHLEGYVGTDILSRYLRMRGYSVLHPMGWDAFGLPAENYAIQTGIHPDKSTHQNIANFKRQLTASGLSYDWSREIDTSSPEFYKWTQWLFILMFRRGLAYKKKAPVNWCPKDETVLANEQVVDGKCERCDTPVVQKELEQWFLKITDYADRLISGLEKVDWPSEVKLQQVNWIGKSKGLDVIYQVEKSDLKITVWTKFWETVFGTTFLALAPEHSILEKLKIPGSHKKEVDKYIKTSLSKSVEERKEAKEKTGAFTGLYAVNPVDKRRVPIWTADYVLSDVGTGAVMGVPAHDERDFEFAKKYNLEIVPVVVPEREYQDTDAKSYYQKRSELHKKLLIGLARDANKEGKKLIVMGGWAVYLEVGREFRDFEDLDLIILEDDLEWWKVKLSSYGLKLSNMFPEGKNPEYYFQATKKDVHVDVLVVKINKKGHVVFLSDKEPEPTKNLFEEMFGKKLIENCPVYALNKDFLYEWKIAHSKKELRWKEKADFLFMGLQSYEGEGILVNSGKFDGMAAWGDGKEKMAEWMIKEEFANWRETYHLRDWLISRQRYWGCPIPMIYCESCARLPAPDGAAVGGQGWQPVPEKELPVLLSTDVDFLPHGESPIARSKKFQKDVVCPNCGKPARREVDTMDTYVDSSWYFIRFVDPKNDREFAAPEKIKQWLPVDVYVGGGHVVQHLLFARFFWKVLFDAGLIKKSLGDEPFLRLRAPGWILGSDSRKMSKRWNNVVTPDEVIPKFGADTLRVYEMFMGPFEAMKPWNITGVEGASRFLGRVWKLYADYSNVVLETEADSRQVLTKMHQTVKSVTEDIEGFRFNTAIASMMEFVNLLYEKITINHQPLTINQKIKCAEWDEALQTLCLIIAPFAPFMAEEIWCELLGKPFSVHTSAWPKYKEEFLKIEEVEIAVQVNGKLRGQLTVNSEQSKSKEDIEEMARKNEKVAKWVAGKTIKKTIFVQGRLINFVV